MPSIDIDLDVNEFLEQCTSYDIKKLIEYLKEDGHIEEDVEVIQPKTLWEGEFFEKLDKLKTKYYSLSQEDSEVLDSLFKKYI